VRATDLWFDVLSGEAAAPRCRSGQAILSQYTASYREFGRGSALVLAPGLAGGVALAAPLAEELARFCRVYAYELRGEEDCFALRRQFELSDLADDLFEFVETLQLEQPIICGVSFGAVISLEFAARYPRRLSGLIVQGADVRFHRTLLRMIAGQVLAGYPLPANHSFVRQFFNLLLGRPSQDVGLFEQIARQCWTTDQSIMAHRFSLAEKVNLSGLLARIQVPTLVLAGDRDVLVSNQGLQEMRQSIRDSRVVTLPEAGHLAFVTHAGPFAAEVRRWAAEAQLDSAFAATAPDKLR
jgi:3-oxoadipate enol-lactonase